MEANEHLIDLIIEALNINWIDTMISDDTYVRVIINANVFQYVANGLVIITRRHASENVNNCVFRQRGIHYRLAFYLTELFYNFSDVHLKCTENYTNRQLDDDDVGNCFVFAICGI